MKYFYLGRHDNKNYKDDFYIHQYSQGTRVIELAHQKDKESLPPQNPSRGDPVSVESLPGNRKDTLPFLKLFSLSHEEMPGRRKQRRGVNVSLMIKFRIEWIRGMATKVKVRWRYALEA